jgi:glucose/mannose-6-phosphate isomerase
MSSPILDDLSVIKQRDPQDALGVAAQEFSQLTFEARIEGSLPDGFTPAQVVVAGMGGSALAAGLIQDWLQMGAPYEVVRRYEVPAYVTSDTLVIISSYSGNTEETISALRTAEERGATIAVIASGGQLIDIAREKNLPYVMLPGGLQPRMTVFYQLRALSRFLDNCGLAQGTFEELAQASQWLDEQVRNWLPGVPSEQNLAKQLAEQSLGKTPVVYAGPKMGAVAYKWKISFNENAKNVAFMGVLPEFNHNEFLGWTSHPVDKPYAVFDLISSFEHERVLKRFEISDRLLSGKRPKSRVVNLEGEAYVQQMLWGCVLADFTSVYLAILNGVNPTPVDIIEKLKDELKK